MKLPGSGTTSNWIDTMAAILVNVCPNPLPDVVRKSDFAEAKIGSLKVRSFSPVLV